MTNLKGKIFYTSWGYDMTMNDYLVVLENSDKTARCVMIGSHVQNDDGMGRGKSFPDPEKATSQPFRLRIKQYGDTDIFLRGSYEFCNGSKRRDTFMPYTNGGNYYNTWD